MVFQNKSTLFERMGGVGAVRALVDEFYLRLSKDPDLMFFFDDAVKITALKVHQLAFLRVAFTGVPEGVDVVALLIEKHKRLFQAKGMNASHFDKVAVHLVESLRFLKTPPELIEEAANVVLPLRIAFEKGAEMYGIHESEDAELMKEASDIVVPLQTTVIDAEMDARPEKQKNGINTPPPKRSSSIYKYLPRFK